MGPHVFACGNAERTSIFAPISELQWGRTFLRAEMRRPGQRRRRSPVCFNGAARFCVRKSVAAQTLVEFGGRFNGAARFCVRKSSSRIA